MPIKYLVIVESPSKCSKIKEYLGNEYIVKASFGHIVNLDSKTLSIDTETLLPKYHIMKDKIKVVKELKELSKKYETIIATDDDIEGESIGFHLTNILKLKKPKRLIFNEITKNALQKAINNPTTINQNKVNNQQSRRVIDRLVGYLLTPILWNKISNNDIKNESISVGRVQSIVLRILCDKELEIKKFSSNKNFVINVDLFNKILLNAKLKETNLITEENQVIDIIDKGKENNYELTDINVIRLTNNPRPPFITSSLQQEANIKFSFSAKNTMIHAQKLYESGLITYMRTDSTNLSEDILISIRDYILENFGENYYKKQIYSKKSKNKTQEAHEAIRPTNINFDYNNIADENQKKLYKLILKRTIACQMSSYVYDEYNYNFQICNYNKYNFIYKSNKVIFDGFKKVYNPQEIKEDNEEDETNNEYSSKLKNVKIGDIFIMNKLNAIEKYKPPPSRYTEGSLIKKLDTLGIGRPSTYAVMLSAILSKKYAYIGDTEGEKVNVLEIVYKSDKINKKEVEKMFGADKKKLLITSLGEIVNKFIIENFNELINYDFTRIMEENLDLIENNKIDWLKITKQYYNNIKNITNNIDMSSTNMSSNNITQIPLGKNPETKNNIVKYVGKFGPVVREDLGDNKYKYGNIKSNFDEFTLEDGIKLLKYPYIKFNFEDKPVEICNGQYGIYFKYNGKNYNFKNYSEDTLTKKNISEIVNNSENTSSVIKKLNNSVSIMNGQYGPYIKTQKGNYKIPPNYNIDTIDLEVCKEIINIKKTYKKNTD